MDASILCEVPLQEGNERCNTGYNIKIKYGLDISLVKISSPVLRHISSFVCY
jgi:hypothetical protein